MGRSGDSPGDCADCAGRMNMTVPMKISSEINTILVLDAFVMVLDIVSISICDDCNGDIYSLILG